MRKSRVRGSIASGSTPALEKMNLGWPSDCAIAFRHLAAAGVVLAHEEDAKGIGPGVLGVLARAHVERLHAHVAGLVGHPLEAPPDVDERLQHLGLDQLLLERLEEVAVELAEERVHGGLHQDDALRQRGVLPHEGVDRVVEHRDREVGHLHDPVTDGRGRGKAAQPQELAGDALRVVAHALELEVDLDRAVGEAEGHPDGLLPDQELEAEPVDLLLLLVDVLVAQDDRVGLLAVAAGEGLDAVPERPLREGGHLQHLLADALDVALERLFESGGHGPEAP